jgi:DNA polymerase IV
MRTILHVDMDAFFAAVETRERPELQGKPVVVGADPKNGKGRGVVAACSYEARRYGIHSAQPIVQAWRLCPHAVYLPPNGRLYSVASRRIMAVLSSYTDLMEQLSIDEAFLDVTGSYRLFGSGEKIAREIKSRIRKEERLTASIGMASSKFLAKIASDLNKPDGMVIVLPGQEKQFLAPLPVSRVWGVGEKTAAMLRERGWEHIGQIASLPASVLEEHLGDHGRHLWELANGCDDRPVVADEGYKSLGHEITYSQDTDDPAIWHATMLEMVDRVAHRLRSHGAAGRTVTLKVRFEDFATFTRRKTVRDLLTTTEEILPIAEQLFQEFARARRRIRLIGVYLSHLCHEGLIAQRSLFDTEHRRLESISRAVDRIEEKFGNGIIRRATLVKKS